MDDELEYLAPGFDPASLTVPKLRAILVEHDIQYPASAKKAQLVDIFTDQLKPRARKILSARERIRRTSRGITDVPSSQEGTINGDDEESMPPPPVPKTPGRRPRKSVRPEEAEEPSTSRRTPSRKSSTKRIRPSESDPALNGEAKSSGVRRARKSEATPQVKIEEPEPSTRNSDLDRSVFTYDNPFQSGSSPMTGEEPRRRTSGKGEKRKSTSTSRRTTGEHQKRQSGNAASFEMPVSRMRDSRLKREPQESVEPGEEFTEEAHQELVREGVKRGEVDVLRPRKSKSKRTSTVPKSAPWVILMTLLAGYGMWYRQEKLAIGYDGVGKTVTAMDEYNVPDWAKEFLQPQSEPCPPHAVCYEGMRVECDRDYVLQQHPLSLAGLVPLPPTCEPDSEKQRKVQAVANRATEELRERRAQYECGKLTEEDGTPATGAEMEESKLKAAVSKKRRKGMSDAEFDQLWTPALGEVLGREEVSSDGDGYVNTRRLSSSSLARISFGCAIRRSALQTLARYRLQLVGLISLISLVAYIRLTIQRRLSDRARVPALVANTLDRLATQAALHAQGSTPEPFISMGQMRDDVLRDEFSIKRRDDIWNRVKQVVEMNTNVRANVKENRYGEISRQWEWIGGLPTLEDGWGGDRRQSGRYSMGSRLSPERNPTPVKDGTPMEVRRWDEGRPIY